MSKIVFLNGGCFSSFVSTTAKKRAMLQGARISRVTTKKFQRATNFQYLCELANGRKILEPANSNNKKD